MTDTYKNLSSHTRLAIESAIHRLLASYIHRLDNGDFAGVADILQHAELDVLGNLVLGRDALQSFFETGIQVHADGTPRTWHTVANVIIDIEPSGEKAKSASYYTVHQQLDGFSLQAICTGKYIDEFELHDGQWRFSRRAVTLHLVGNLQHHVKGLNKEAVS